MEPFEEVREQNPMKAASCPMCRGDRWYDGRMAVYVKIWLKFFHRVPVQCRVCLTCGFVAPFVDEAGLAEVTKEMRKLPR
jgi:hypothetical protein